MKWVRGLGWVLAALLVYGVATDPQGTAQSIAHVGGFLGLAGDQGSAFMEEGAKHLPQR